MAGIKNFDLPNYCNDCPFCIDSFGDCDLKNEHIPDYDFFSNENEKPSWCPLIADVVERSKIDKAIEELRKEIEENHLNVIAFANGEWIVKDFVYGAIDRFEKNIGE